MKISATRLRAELYQVLDEVLKTGECVEISRPAGTVLLQRSPGKATARRKKKGRGNPRLVVGNSDELIHFDWTPTWKPFL